MVTDKGTKLDQAPYTKSIVIEGIGSRFAQRFHTTRLGDGFITQAREQTRTRQLKFSLLDNFGGAHVPGGNDKTGYLLQRSRD